MPIAPGPQHESVLTPMQTIPTEDLPFTDRWQSRKIRSRSSAGPLHLRDTATRSCQEISCRQDALPLLPF